MATYWLHRPTYFDPISDEGSLRDRPNYWYALVAPVNTLDLHGEDLIDDAKLAHIVEKHESATGAQRWVATLSLSGRDLTGADLSEADVRQVDFSGAILNRANLRFAWENEAQFNQAQLKGASLDGARLQGISLVSAQLQGATLVSAQLQGASLYNAKLQGALLGQSQLQGAAVEFAQLQGAWLKYAQLQGASFEHVCAWRADARQAAWKDTRVAHPVTGPNADKVPECDWTVDSFTVFKQLITK